MTDDIVERLREYADNNGRGVPSMHEAADEIERLRVWEAELRGLGKIVGVSDPDASAQVIGDAITSERDTLRFTLLSKKF